ncbi:hypothetical protein U9M48_002609 [Paspalum notatum var. saurae]|uniref:Reverse transcriptase Ty1/copia-type domain-containing protein n=1 Tax=Paspalum notatum var. saurae TaxID=547442 RepID=A0AAQ3PPF4_PASNO
MAWHSRLTSKLQEIGFSSSATDASLFIFRQGKIFIYMLIYVDDIIVVTSSNDAIDKLIQKLKGDFPVKDLGPLEYFLGMESPIDMHWDEVKQILRYVKGSVDHGVKIQKSSSTLLSGFCDPDWAGDCPDDCKSTSGFTVAPRLWCDNLGATYLTTNPMFHGRAKDSEVDFHLVRDKQLASRKAI